MNNDNNAALRFLAGIALAGVGIAIMLFNIDVTSFGFYRIAGKIDTAVVLLFILAAFIVWGIISNKRLPWLLVAFDLVMIIVSVLIGTRFVFRRMNAFTIILIIAMIAVGIGLVISGIFGIRKRK